MTVTTTPTPLMNTTEGTRYAVQNKGVALVYIHSADDTPSVEDDTGQAFVVERFAFGYPEPGTGESVYVWTQPDSRGVNTTSLIAYEEA